MLGEWWQAEQLPPVQRLTADQVALVLARIALLEWDGRPF